MLGNLNPDTYTPFDIKYLTDGSIDSHVEGPGGAVAGTGVDLPAEAAPNESILVFKWDDINSQVTWYCYKPGTKTLQIVSDTDSTATLSVPTAIPSNQEIVIGGNTVGVSYTTYLQNMSVRDF